MRAQEEKKFADKDAKKKKTEQSALIASLFKAVTTVQTGADGEGKYPEYHPMKV